VVDLLKVGAHYAISSLFERYPDRMRLYAYTVEREDQRVVEAGWARLLLGRASVWSEVTRERASLSYGALHYGHHTVVGGVREHRGEEAFEELVGDATAAFEQADFAEAVRVMDRHFESSSYSLKTLFKDEQRKLLGLILESTLEQTGALYGQVYEKNAPLMRFIGGLGVPLPRVLRVTAEYVLNSSLQALFQADRPDLDRARALLEAAEREGAELDGAGLSFVVTKSLERLMEEFHGAWAEPEPLARLSATARFAEALPFEVDLSRTQDLYWDLRREVYPGQRAAGDEASRAWCRAFEGLGADLGMGPAEAERAGNELAPE